MAGEKSPDPRPRVLTGPRLGRIHDRVLHVLSEVDAGAPADRALANAFRRARDLGSHDRAVVKEEVYGLLRYRRVVQDTLQRAAQSLRKPLELLDAPILARLELLTHLSLSGATVAELEARDRYAARRIPKLLEKVASGRLPPAKHGPVEAEAIRVSLPTWIFRRMVEALGSETAATVGQALLHRAPVTLRVDPNRVERQSILDKLAEAGLGARPTEAAPFGINLDQPHDLRDWDELADARVEVQDEGSQLIGHAVGARPGHRVLDACAGAGGKTLALWSEMQGRGELVAVEPDAKKRDTLRKRLHAAGANRVRVVAGDLEAVSSEWRERFDCILVDAPCTGTGTLRRHPDLKWRIDESQLSQEVGRQTHLLGAAAPLLVPGGRLVYATCSVLAEENEAVAETFAGVADDLDPAPLEAGWGPEIDRQLGMKGDAAGRIGPGAEGRGPDGFFVSAFTRRR